jgi:uncharacterized protein (TIGR03086 family)
MSTQSETAALIGGVGLLERSINYTLGSLHLAGSAAMSQRTPCRHWDLRTLLAHLDDSLSALHEAVVIGAIDPAGPDVQTTPPDGGTRAELVGRLRDRAGELLGAWAGADARRQLISIAGSELTAGIVTSTGAIEIAVHGWDIAQSCGASRPIPAALAEELLELAPLLVSDADRGNRFAAPVPLSAPACPGDQLIAFLGRHPHPCAASH